MRKKGRKVRYTPVDPDFVDGSHSSDAEDGAFRSVELGDLSSVPAMPRESPKSLRVERDEAQSPASLQDQSSSQESGLDAGAQSKDIRVLKKRTLKLLFAFVCALPFLITAPGHKDRDAILTAGITVFMAIMWISEAIPMEVTSLIPIALFPLFDLMSGKEVTRLYFNDSSYIFIGSGMLAKAVEKYDLHRRIALNIIAFMGSDPRRIILSFIVASGFMSMWIDNISTSLIMTPMAIAIIQKLETTVQTDAHRDAFQSFSTGLILAVTYANSIGGTATLTGTVPQVIFLGQLNKLFPGAPQVSFARWAFFAIPAMILFNFITWIYIVRLYCWKQRDNLPAIDMTDLRDQLRKLGPMKFAEWGVLLAFGFTAFLWFFRDPDFMTGWSWSPFITDSTPPLSMAILLFMVPHKPYSPKGILELDDITSMPWGLFIFLGGGFALSREFEKSGLSKIVGDFLSRADFLPPFWILFFISFFMASLTEIVSNTAATALFLPIIAELAVGIRIDPRFLMVPATITASYAFMFPVATGPNAIAYNTGTMTIRQMAFTGFFLNIIGMFLITGCMYTLGVAVYDIDLDTFPDWAHTPSP